MSTTLNLADRLLARGRRYQQAGRPRDAFHILRRLSTFRELSPDAAEETQLRLAEILVARGRFRRARRHLAAALAHQPEQPRYHYLMAVAAEGGSEADLERAADHYRRSLELDDGQPHAHAGYGRLLQRLGRVEEGLASLRRAAELAADDPEVVGSLAGALCLAGRAGEAREVLRAALFRNPRDGRFRTLWSDHQFQELRKQQEMERLEQRAEDAEDEPVLLPFVRVESESSPAPWSRRILRLDPAAPTPPPHLPPVSASRQRHAQ